MKKEHSHMNDDVLMMHLLGETTEQQNSMVADWLKENDANKHHYEQIKTIWNTSKQLAATKTVDTNKAWDRFQQRVNEAPATKTIAMPQRKMSWMQIAATLVLFIGAAWMVKFFAYDFGRTTIVADNTVISETLPDGTVVTLNKASSLKYKTSFDGATRSVTLSGEAFFDVTPNKERPFIIDVDGVEVKVLGTSFNVKSETAKTEVIVETGLVEVSKKENSIKVKPNEKAVVLKDNPAPIKQANEDALYSYYRTKEFVCNNTPLSRLVDVLNDAYDAKIIIANDNLKSLEITTTFKDEPLDYILDVICEQLSIKKEKTGNKIILK